MSTQKNTELNSTGINSFTYHNKTEGLMDYEWKHAVTCK